MNLLLTSMLAGPVNVLVWLAVIIIVVLVVAWALRRF